VAAILLFADHRRHDLLEKCSCQAASSGPSRPVTDGSCGTCSAMVINGLEPLTCW